MPFLLRCFIFLFFIGNGLRAVSQVDLNNGLVAWLPFSSSMSDASGNANHGIPEGTSYTTDRFGNANRAVSLNGISDFVSIADPSGQFSSTPFSIVLWIQTDDYRYSCLLGKRAYGPTNGQQYQLSLFRPFFGLFSGVTSDLLPCPGDLTLDVMNVANYNEAFCLLNWHNIIVTFDGTVQRLYFDGVKVDETTWSYSEMQKCNSDIRLGNWWSGDPLYFKGKMDDFRWYNRVINSDEITALAMDKGSNRPFAIDFSQYRELCEPRKLSLNSVSEYQGVNRLWRLGDGNFRQFDASISHTYSQDGKYPVTLIVDHNGPCMDSVTKWVDMSVIPADVIFANDSVVCLGDTVTLNTVPASAVCWSPQSVIQKDPNNGSSFIVPTSAMAVDVNLYPSLPNLVVNGDFKDGNLGFTSDLQQTNSRNGDSQYNVVSDPRAWYSAIACAACADQGGLPGGKLMVVDGSTDTSNAVWCQTISIKPQTNYVLGFSRNNYSTTNAAAPSMYINGLRIGTIQPEASPSGSWYDTSYQWNSGTLNSIDLCIRLSTNSAQGNVLGIDDIFVRELRMERDRLNITIGGAPTLTMPTDTSICLGDSVQLIVGGGIRYSWSPSEGLSDPLADRPMASPARTTWYKVLADGGKCATADSVLVTIFELPVIAVSSDQTICQGDTVVLAATGAASVEWTPAFYLDDPLAGSPSAFPDRDIRYQVKGTDGNGCTDTAYVNIHVLPNQPLLIPNAFTPNADGKNDCFRIPNTIGALSFELAIFDRYGGRVFYSRDPSACWDGKFLNRDLPVGNYTYFLRTVTSCGEESRKGFITLIR